MWLIAEYALILRLKIHGLFNKQPPNEWGYGQKGIALLVPGLHESWTFFEKIGNRLNQMGYRVLYVSTLGSFRKKTEILVEELRVYIENQRIDTCTIVAHSKGGIVAKLLLDEGTNTNIARLISIATPYQGTWWGFLPFRHIRELHPQSKIIKNVAQNRGNNHRCTNLYPFMDNHILIAGSSSLPNATNIELPVKGHTRILFDSHTIDTIMKIFT